MRLRFKRIWKFFQAIALIFIVMLTAYFVQSWTNQTQIVKAGKNPPVAADGDSFSMDGKKYRLRGIDAPEYHQTCQDDKGQSWNCGRASRASLEKLLQEPQLVCEYEVRDRYGRFLANCSTRTNPDLAAAQVREGMAMSQEYYDVRDYPDEEDAAKGAKRGIWQGSFVPPSQWRAQSHRQPL